MDIEQIFTQVDAETQQVDSAEGLEAFQLKYLGRKGVLAQLTGTIPGLPAGERALFGQKANALKNKILGLVEEKKKTLSLAQGEQAETGFDLSLPGIAREIGHLHPITQVMEEICAVFLRMGFSVVEGPEIETEYNNFTALNIPLDHPSRDAFDTFYLKLAGEQVSGLAGSTRAPAHPRTRQLLLRSHTSPVQIRVMQERKPPLAVVVPGRVYRPDAVDASHSFMFHQIEGFMVDKGIKFSDLKGVLEIFAKNVFGENIRMRFRPHFFPFTEPSAEVDISCIICQGRDPSNPCLPQPARLAGAGRDNREPKTCPVCHGKRWLEILGSGMIHPNVFRHVGYDPKKYSGFAFGMGVERIAMLKYGIDDIRLFFENDLRFLKQF
ncbi:MAG: phenylalanine--tRNA ligase subunit alpha [Candidatus Omnitrophota bacterium]|nr:phenylalanine--tRNA ligase subunit alpha [Candidatus Omnitrophota bacterium]